MSLQKFLGPLIAGVAVFVSAGSIQAAQNFASPLFAQRWQQDEQVVPNFWGPLADAHPGQPEPYGGEDVCRPPRQCPARIPDGSATGQRLVQYFDKGRMELTQGGQGTIVTSGLLVHELITGQLQLGDTQFQALAPATVPIAGDRTTAFPLYRDLGSGAAASTMTPAGTPVTLLLTPQGGSAIPRPRDEQTVVSLIDTQTGHGLPKGFADFRSRVGLQNVGLALTDPFWADVQIAGTTQRILIQAYERRVLTYNPANPAQFQVEFGNVGQQYYLWRYGAPLSAAPSSTDPVSPPVTPKPPGGTRIVMLADDGQTIAFFRGMSLVLSLDAVVGLLPAGQRAGDPALQAYIAAGREAVGREGAERLRALRGMLARLLIRRVSWENAGGTLVVEWTEEAATLLRRAGVGTVEGPSYRLDGEALHLRVAPLPPPAPPR